MENHLGTFGQILGLLIPLILIAVAWGKYSAKAKEHDDAIARLYVKDKESTDKCAVLQREYLSDSEHQMKCKVATMEIEKAIRQSTDEVKVKVEETMVDFQKTFNAMFKDLVKEVKNNSKEANV